MHAAGMHLHACNLLWRGPLGTKIVHQTSTRAFKISGCLKLAPKRLEVVWNVQASTSPKMWAQSTWSFWRSLCEPRTARGLADSCLSMGHSPLRPPLLALQLDKMSL